MKKKLLLLSIWLFAITFCSGQNQYPFGKIKTQQPKEAPTTIPSPEGYTITTNEPDLPARA